MTLNEQCDNWYVAFTKPRTERRFASKMYEIGVESYLPTYKVVKQWSDRKKKVEVPLFPNYVFVKTNEMTRLSLYTINDLVRFVSIERKPVIVREKEIYNIKLALSGNW